MSLHSFALIATAFAVVAVAYHYPTIVQQLKKMSQGSSTAPASPAPATPSRKRAFPEEVSVANLTGWVSHPIDLIRQKEDKTYETIHTIPPAGEVRAATAPAPAPKMTTINIGTDFSTDVPVITQPVYTGVVPNEKFEAAAADASAFGVFSALAADGVAAHESYKGTITTSGFGADSVFDPQAKKIRGVKALCFKARSPAVPTSSSSSSSPAPAAAPAVVIPDVISAHAFHNFARDPLSIRDVHGDILIDRPSLTFVELTYDQVREAGHLVLTDGAKVPFDFTSMPNFNGVKSNPTFEALAKDDAATRSAAVFGMMVGPAAHRVWPGHIFMVNTGPGAVIRDANNAIIGSTSLIYLGHGATLLAAEKAAATAAAL